MDIVLYIILCYCCRCFGIGGHGVDGHRAIHRAIHNTVLLFNY